MSDSARQQQFLDVVDRDEATRRFQAALNLDPLGTETIDLSQAHGRVLAEDIAADIDVTGFDRSNVDGVAVVAAATVGATEETPVRLRLNEETIAPGVTPDCVVTDGKATPIATGGMIPRGADAVVMIEDTDPDGDDAILVVRPVATGNAISFAGTDIARGETILRRKQLLTSREIGVLAALGRTAVSVYRRPRVAIISTGNEIVEPGNPLPTGCVYDSNQAILSAAISEAGGDPVPSGVVRDNENQLRDALNQAANCDAVILSGGTSKGEGDLCYRVVAELSNPGILAHGVALKPGKPVCLAVDHGRPVVVLPGFPTSAVFTFHEFVAPVIRSWSGQSEPKQSSVHARLATRINSDRGRTEYVLVHLLEGSDGVAAYPMGKGSGSVTAFSMADGFITIDQHTEIADENSTVAVTRLSESLQPADLVVIGSHCRGVDLLLSEMQTRGFSTKLLNVGSLAGIHAALRGECDIAGVHLLDEATGVYNQQWVTPSLLLVPGYDRTQCVVVRPDDPRFSDQDAQRIVQAALADPDCVLVNRNRGSGTRVLIDELLADTKPPGFAVEARSHNAVCAAIAQGRADWGVAIEPVAAEYDLKTARLRNEEYDFVIPANRRDRLGVHAFAQLLQDPEVRRRLAALGFTERAT